MKKSIASVLLLALVSSAVPLLAQAQCEPARVSAFANDVAPPTNFGTVAVGTSKGIAVGGTNTSLQSLSIFVGLSGPNAGDFSIINPCSESPLGPRGTCTGLVTFTPRSPGQKSAELLIVMRGIADPEVNRFVPTMETPSEWCEPDPTPIENGFVRMVTLPLTGVGR